MSETYFTIPNAVLSYTTNVTNPTYALSDYDSTTCATLDAVIKTSSTTATGNTSNLYLSFDLSAVPSNAVVESMSVTVKWSKSVTRSGTFKTSSATAAFYIYPSSSSTSYGTYSNTSISTVAERTNTITVNSESVIGQTISSIDLPLRLRCYSYVRASSKTAGSQVRLYQYLSVFGARLTLTYSVAGVRFKIKIDGSWKDSSIKTKADGAIHSCDKAFVKVDGLWRLIV